MDVTGSIVVAGVLNAALLFILTASRWRRNDAAIWLCLIFALLSAAAAAILIQHRLEGLGERAAVTVEQIASYAAPPVLYAYVRTALGPPLALGHILIHFLPATVFLLIGAPLTLSGASEPPPFQLTIGYMMAYTVASLVVLGRAVLHNGLELRMAWPAAVMATMVAIHVGQIVRITSDSPAVQDIVALSGAIAVFGLLALALAGVVPWANAKASRYARSGASNEALRLEFRKMRQLLEQQDMYQRSDLRLSDLASAAGLNAHRASQALSQGGHVSFHELLAEVRVTEAKRLLTLAENRRVAVEPLGMMAGFRSRSAFYKAFQKAVGMTPAEYRRAQGEESCSPQSGRTRKT